MNDDEKWLITRRRSNPALDEGERYIINRLAAVQMPEADLSSCIDVLEVLLSLDALQSLVTFIKDARHSISLRTQAAKAIANIGSSYVESDLCALLSSPSAELRLLADIALNCMSPEK